MGKWKWHTGLEAGDGPEIFDDRTIFEQKCRSRNTRINWIMTMIERGMSDEVIAERVKRACGVTVEEECNARVISVYRKALNDQLCDMGTGREGQGAGAINQVTLHYRLVGSLYFGKRMSRGAIGELLSLSASTVRSCIERYRREFGGEKRRKGHGGAEPMGEG